LADPNTRQGKRTPVTLKIKFKSETLEQFIERYAVDVSQGGIFIRTKEPLAVGTQMKFEFQLRDASPLIAGEGTVVWTRENDPSRPAIAPGMGVRFDRLADGSQTVLEKILAEKAKQAPSRSHGETAPGQKQPQMFAEVPTKVAPAPIQEALGLRSSRDSETTPLPKPMPFHSDADDFDEKAFDEATKVRSLDDLAKESLGEEEDDGAGLSDNPKQQTVMMPADELAVRRRVSAEHLVPPASDSGKDLPKAVPDRDSAPALPSAPAVEASNRAARVESKPPPEPEPAPEPEPETETLDEEVAEAKPEPEPVRPAARAVENAAPRATVAKEPSRPQAPSRPSSAPLVIMLLLAVAAVAGAVWFFVLRDDGSSKKTVDNPQPDKGSAAVVDKGGNTGTTPGSNDGSATNPDVGSNGSATAQTGSDDGSAGTMTGSNAGSDTGSAAGPTVDTVIAAAKGATIEIVGTEQKGPAPFTAKLEKDKAYKAHVTAPGYLPADIDVKGGEKTTAKLTIKPHVLSITSDPAGADIYVDGVNTNKITPSDVELTAAQAAKPPVRISLRRPGFRPVDQMVEASAFKDAGEKTSTSLTIKLQVQPQVVKPPQGGGGGSAAGSATEGTGGGESGTGGGTGGGDSGGSAAAPPPPPPPPTPAPAAGSAAPSGGQILK